MTLFTDKQQIEQGAGRPSDPFLFTVETIFFYFDSY